MHRLGSTPLAVSALGFGTGDNAGLMVSGTARDRLAALERACEAGVNYFDTSPDYGKGVAEYNLGAGLRRIGYGEAIVCTKVELHPHHLTDLATAVEASVEGSLGRLGRDCIDILMVHNPVRVERPEEWGRGWMPLTIDELLGPVREGVQRVVQKGKARYVGVASEHSDIEPTCKAYDSGLFQVANVLFNLSNPTACARYTPKGVGDRDYRGVLDRAAANGIGTAIIRPLAGGALTDAAMGDATRARHALAARGTSAKTGRLYDYDAEVERARVAGRMAKELDMEVTELAYRFLLSTPEVSTIIGGFSDLAQLEQCLAHEAKGPLGPDQLAAVDAEIAAAGSET